MDDLNEDLEIYNCYSKNDFSEMCKMIKRVMETNHITPLNLWGLPKRASDSDIYQDDQLSE